MLVAAGPFTTSDSLLYEPLADLMKTVQKDKPDLLILVSRKKRWKVKFQLDHEIINFRFLFLLSWDPLLIPSTSKSW